MRPTRPRTLALAFAAIAAASLAFAACGDDDDATATPTSIGVTVVSGVTTPASTKSPEASPTVKPSTTASVSSTAATTPTLVTNRGTTAKAVEKTVPASTKQATVTGAQTQDQNKREAFGFSFSGPIPGYKVEYVKEARECGSGAVADMQGAAGILVVTMRPAVAHGDDGKSTVTRGGFLSTGKFIKGIRQICDFEGVVSFAIGLTSTDPFEVIELDSTTLGIVVGKAN